MLLKASCHCGAVRFSVKSRTPYPYMHCYCTICRKTAGGGGYAVNIMGEARSLKLEGREHLSIYRARGAADSSGELSEAQRHFCELCGSALYISDPRWPDWIYPFASAIDTPLPTPPERAHIMLDFKAPWVEAPSNAINKSFDCYPDLSIEGWHKSHELQETDN